MPTSSRMPCRRGGSSKGARRERACRRRGNAAYTQGLNPERASGAAGGKEAGGERRALHQGSPGEVGQGFAGRAELRVCSVESGLVECPPAASPLFHHQRAAAAEQNKQHENQGHL